CIDAMGGVTQKIYDANGNLMRKLEYANPVPATTMLTQTAVAKAITPSANDRVTRTVYDAANRPTFTIDATGYITQHVSDNNGNVTQKEGHAKPLTSTLTHK